MANQTGIAIVIKAFLPTGKTLDEQFNALSIVKEAHATGDYAALLRAANVENVLTEQKTRRIETGPDTDGQAGEGDQTTRNHLTQGDNGNGVISSEADQTPGQEPNTKPEPAADADVPAFLKTDKKSKAA